MHGNFTSKHINISRQNTPDENYITNPKKNVGHNAINGSMHTLARICDFQDWQNCTNHGNWAYAVTKLVNNEEHHVGLNKEVLNHSRHSSYKSQQTYIRTNSTIKSKLQNALCAVPPPQNRVSTV